MRVLGWCASAAIVAALGGGAQAQTVRTEATPFVIRAAPAAQGEQLANPRQPLLVQPVVSMRSARLEEGATTAFGVGPKETRAWTIPSCATGPQAAGVIHTDFERGFIRAETIAYEDYVGLGGEARAREAGKLRAEGKTYVVRDGDVMNFLFSG